MNPLYVVYALTRGHCKCHGMVPEKMKQKGHGARNGVRVFRDAA